MEPAGGDPVLKLGPAQYHGRLHIDQLAAPCIRNPELECGDASVRSEDRILAENNLCAGPGKPGEQYSGRESESEESRQGLDGHQDVRGKPVRADSPVADRRERLDAE